MADRKTEDVLGEVALFSSLTPRYLTVLANSCTERDFKADETIIEQGVQGVGLMVIVSGSARVMKKLASGEQVEVGTLAAGEFFGEISVLDDAPRTASVIAVESTQCLVLSSWSFKAAMGKHPEIAAEMLTVVLQRYRNTHQKLSELEIGVDATD